MWRCVVVVGLVGAFWERTALGDTSHIDFTEAEIGAGEAKLQPGMCSQGGFGGYCDPGWNHLARISAARGRRIESWLSLIGRGGIDGVLRSDSLVLMRGFLGGGVRAEVPGGRAFADVMIAIDFQVASTGSGESGIALGPSVGPELRAGVRYRNWFVAVETIAMPLNRGTLGLDAFDVAVAAGLQWPS